MIRYLLFVVVAVLGIYLIVDFFQRIDNFISADLKAFKIVLYFFSSIPSVIVQVLPVCLLLSVVIALGLMNKHNEILALKSCGIGFDFLLRPVMALGLVITVCVFFLNEVVVPLTVPVSNKIWIEDVKKKDIVTTKEENIWMKGHRSITHIKHFNPVENKIYGVTVYSFDDHFMLQERFDAASGTYSDQGWLLEGVLHQKRDTENGTYQIAFLDTEVRSLALLPEDLLVVVKKSEEMSFKELQEYIQKVEEEGYDATIYKVDLYGKTALPFVCVILALIGAGIGVKKHIKEGLPVGIAYGLGVYFLYWVFYSFSMSLGYGGLIPPMIAAWTPNLVFSAWGIYLSLNN
jgi:lipopolysaccharide export system permease protein